MRLLQDDKIPDTGGSFLEKIKKAIHNDFKYTCCIAALYGIGLSLFKGQENIAFHQCTNPNWTVQYQ
jgi:hypothetical protein